MKRVLFGFCLAALTIMMNGSVTLLAASAITELTVADLADAARDNEPVRMGIPLARGLVKEPGELALTDGAGKAVPCQFREIMRWPEDQSLRWAHVVFQADVPAKGSKVFKLVKGPAAQSPKKVEVTEAGGAVIVANGLLKATVKGANFNVFDSVAVGGVDVVKPHKDGFVATIGGKAYRPGADSKVEVEEKGSETAVLKVSGRLVGDDGKGPFDYVCYLQFFADSPVVRGSFSYTHSQGAKAEDKVDMDDLSVILPTTLGGGKATVGGEGKNFSGKAGKIVAESSDSSKITMDGGPGGSAKGKSTKPLTIGWADLTKGRQSVAVGVRWFWQMFPRAVEVTADGRVRAGLYAKESGAPLEVYMGQGRTHYVTFLFHAGLDDAKLARFFAGTQVPLRAVAPAAYYCQETEGFGKVASSDPGLYAPDVADRMKKLDEAVKRSAQAIEKKIDGHEYNGVRMDSYGYNAWGDVFHHANEAGNTDKWNILWESNYYDYPWACGLQFARTGDMQLLDIMDRHGLHLGDVFMCKWAPDKKYWGACRYSPPANHVGNDVDWKTPKPYFSVEFNHHKAQSILARWYLLGDFRARDDFMLALNNAMINPEASWRQCRGPGAKLATLYSGYILTRDPQCLEKMKQCMAGAIKLKDNPKGFSKQGKSGYFMMGIATEGMYYYWLLTQDKDTYDTMRNLSEFMMGEGRNSCVGNSACSVAFLYGQTGDEKYKDAALSFLKAADERRPKGFGQSWRNSAYAWYWLSKEAAKEKK